MTGCWDKTMAEEFKEYPYDRDYLVGNMGTIVDNTTGAICKQYQQKSGYVYVWIGKGRLRKHSVPVHKLVAIVWHGEEGYCKGLYVDHKNTIRNDNRAENLHWVTPKGNANNPLTLAKRRKTRIRAVGSALIPKT